MTQCSLRVLTPICNNVYIRFIISLLFIIICIGRVITHYLECYSTIWFDYTLVALFLWALISYIQTNRLHYCILAVLTAFVFVFCLEINFTIPLILGFIGVFSNSQNNRVLYLSLVICALVYLALYGVLVLPRIDSAYDPSHGEQVSVINNAIRMIWSQKILVLTLLLGLVRIFHILKYKLRLNEYDRLFVAAVGFVCAACVLRLNWTLYFTVPALLILPSLLYYSMTYLNSRFSIIIMLLLCVLYGAKIPNSIERNQDHRLLVNYELSELLKMIDEGNELVWYSPATEESYAAIMRDWRREALCANLGWLTNNKEFSIKSTSTYSLDKRVWLTPIENEKLFPEDDQLHSNSRLVFNADDIFGYVANIE